MAKRKWYEWVLTIVYIAMVALCVYLNFTPGHQESIATIVVNAVMFVIVGIIFINADIRSFAPMNAIIADIEEAREKIRKDAMNTHSYLWEPYQSGNVKLFKNEKLAELFQDFIFELNRASDAKNVYYRPNIDDYINDELVDKVMHRNEMNQIPGMLTGLGILGTFIGLSLGLQHFNTGTTAQMTESIEPLMNGIKVAFHTSIYGMVFSLAFNTIYKKKLYEAEASIESFVISFKKYVLPDTQNDGMNQIIALEESQINALNNFADNVNAELDRIISPQFDRLNRTITDFENITTRNETEAIGRIVNDFVNEMNKSLTNVFWQITKAVNEQYEAQKANYDMMGEMLKATGASNTTLNDINHETERLILTLNKYTESIQTIQNELQTTLVSLSEQHNNDSEFVRTAQDLVVKQNDTISEFKLAIDRMAANSADTNDRVNEATEEINNGIDYMKRQVNDMQHQFDNLQRQFESVRTYQNNNNNTNGVGGFQTNVRR